MSDQQAFDLAGEQEQRRQLRAQERRRFANVSTDQAIGGAFRTFCSRLREFDAERLATKRAWRTWDEWEGFFRIALETGMLSREKIDQLLEGNIGPMRDERWGDLNGAFWSRAIGEQYLDVARARQNGVSAMEFHEVRDEVIAQRRRAFDDKQRAIAAARAKAKAVVAKTGKTRDDPEDP